jgi:hypothetical protein
MVDGMRATLYAGCETLEVVGESHRQGNLWAIVGCEPTNDRVRHDCHAILVAEYDNPHDHNAISVWIDRHLVGYLSREDAADYRPGLLKLFERGPVALAVTIGGGGYGGQALLGVFLDHDPADFGVNAAPSPPRQLRTGLSDAFITDRFDDSYDLAGATSCPRTYDERSPSSASSSNTIPTRSTATSCSASSRLGYTGSATPTRQPSPPTTMHAERTTPR